MIKHFLFLLLLLSTFAAKAQLPAALASRLQDTLSYFKDQYTVKGLSAAVSVKEHGTWASAVGMSTASEALTPDMLIGIGSNTKTFLSALVLKLYENGQLDLTDTVGTWISGQPHINGSVTIRQLLTHTSGIAEYLNNTLFDSLNNDPGKYWSREQLFALIGPPNFAPGTSIAYSNSGYIIAGKIMEMITGRPLQELFRDSIFNVAGLSHTFYPPFEPVTDPYAGFWTDIDGNGTPDLASNWNTTGSVLPVNINTIARDAGGIVATAKDVVRFWRNLLKGNIISTNTLNSKMFEWSGFGNADNEYGLGVFLEKYKGTHMYHHGGTWIGQINSNLNDPVNDIYIAVLSNQDSLSNDFTEMVAKAMYDIIYEHQGLSIDATRNELAIKIYPNPTSGQLSIEIPADVAVDQLSLCSVDGKTIKHFPEHKSGLLRYDMQHLPPGTYLINYAINGVVYSRKLIRM